MWCFSISSVLCFGDWGSVLYLLCSRFTSGFTVNSQFQWCSLVSWVHLLEWVLIRVLQVGKENSKRIPLVQPYSQI